MAAAAFGPGAQAKQFHLRRSWVCAGLLEVPRLRLLPRCAGTSGRRRPPTHSVAALAACKLQDAYVSSLWAFVSFPSVLAWNARDMRGQVKSASCQAKRGRICCFGPPVMGVVRLRLPKRDFHEAKAHQRGFPQLTYFGSTQ